MEEASQAEYIKAGVIDEVAEAERACYALNADDALRRKMEPELRKLEVAASRGLLVPGRIE